MVVVIQGKTENIWDDEDYARMLQERLGSDVENYFRERISDERIIETIQDRISEICTGECDTVYKTEEHWKNQMEELVDDLREILNCINKMNRKQISDGLHRVIYRAERQM